MRENKTILLLIIVVLLLFLGISCTNDEKKEPQYPLNGPIPHSEIVFMPDADPIHVKIDSKTLGFIDADGSNRQEYTFKLVGGALSNFGKHIPSQYASHPLWSMDGDELVFGIRDLPPNTRLIAADGRMYGQACKDDIGLTFDLQGNIFTMLSKDDQAYEEYKDISSTILIGRYDLMSCQIVSVFSLPLPFGSFVSEINESNNGFLTAALFDNEEDIEKIYIYNQSTGESQTLLGYHPSLTEDGTLLAYYNRTGSLVIRDMETGEERMLKVYSKNEGWAWSPDYISMPGWSPDNKWLVYNTPEGEIYKINIETKENIYLTYGWAPDWR